MQLHPCSSVSWPCRSTYNTQSTYLLVCASARSTALKATLTDQLHRKFRLVDRLDGELTASVDGVLLAAEDVELMSTALMYFAKALQDGADYAVCNAVFGFGGATALYQSQPLQAQNRCALVSRPLLERCRAAAKDPENVPELLALAAQLCTKPALIPQALLHYERDICAEDAFSAHGKRAFIMSHVLDMTGAPIVLVSAVPVLRSMGYEVLVLGPSDGGSLHLFLDAGASVITRSSCRNVSDAWGMALCADFVIVNTVVMARAVRALSGTAVPVLWWLHDAFAGYPHIAHRFPPSWGECQVYRWAATPPPTPCTPCGPNSDLAAHLRPARLRGRELCPHRSGYNRGRPLFATVARAPFVGTAPQAPQGPRYLLQGHPPAAARGAEKSPFQLCGPGR